MALIMTALLFAVGCASETATSVRPLSTAGTLVTSTPHPTRTPSFLPIAPDRGRRAEADEVADTSAADVVDALSDSGAQAAMVEDDLADDPGDAASAVMADATTAPAAASPTIYRVQAGDTLLGIALDFGVPMAAIQLSNDLGSGTTVWVDQDLQIHQGEIWTGASPFWSVYEVVAGDTLSEVAARFDLEVAALLAANGLSDGDLIAVGQPLILPIDGPVDVGAARGLAAAPPTRVPPATPESEVEVIAEAPSSSAEDEAVQVTIAEVGAPTVTPTAVPEAVADESSVVSNPAPSAELSALANEIFRLVNEQRAAYGLPPLAWSATLARAAQLHADDCYARGWCSHTGSDGSTYKQRIIRAGYNPVRWSECWAWYATPEMAVAMWMDEVPPNDPHRRTILSDYLTEVGVGVVPGNGRGYYFIADFGTPGN